MTSHPPESADASVARPRSGRPAAFFESEFDALAGAARVGPVLDLACGRGRHARALALVGIDVVAVDRNRESLASVAADCADAPSDAGRAQVLQLDLEDGRTPALAPNSFGAVVVFRYLHRPLAPFIQSLLRPGGVLLYETFTTAQRELGWGPKRDDFLLRPGELRSLFADLAVDVFEEGLSQDEPAAETARLRAHRPA